MPNVHGVATARRRSGGRTWLNVAQNWKPTNASWPFNDYYACLFKSKVESWRKAFRSPEMFYGFVSLAAYGGVDADGGAARSASGLPRSMIQTI